MIYGPWKDVVCSICKKNKNNNNNYHHKEVIRTDRRISIETKETPYFTCLKDFRRNMKIYV